MKSISWALGALLASLALAACSATATDGTAGKTPTPSSATSSTPTSSTPTTSTPTTSTPPATTVTTPAAKTAAVTKLLVFVVENRSLSQMKAQMPYTFGLAQQYGYASGYHALAHPSEPNYLAIAGGSMFGVTDDNPPASHVAHGPSVFGQALSLGKTATLYAEGMPSNCSLVPGGDLYQVKHNPWAYFVDERSQCAQHDVPLTTFDADIDAGRLPNAGMVIPDSCNDAHDPGCTLGRADDWMRTHVGRVLAGPDFASGHLAVVVTADEDSYRDGNLILTTVFHPSQHGHVVSTPLTHYSLTRLYDQVIGAPALGQAASAPDMAKAFGLPLSTS